MTERMNNSGKSASHMLEKIYTVTKLAAVRLSGPSLESFTTDMCAQSHPFVFISAAIHRSHLRAHGRDLTKSGQGEDGYWLQASRERAKRDIKAMRGADSSGFDG